MPEDGGVPFFNDRNEDIHNRRLKTFLLKLAQDRPDLQPVRVFLGSRICPPKAWRIRLLSDRGAPRRISQITGPQTATRSAAMASLRRDLTFLGAPRPRRPRLSPRNRFPGHPQTRHPTPPRQRRVDAPHPLTIEKARRDLAKIAAERARRAADHRRSLARLQERALVRATFTGTVTRLERTPTTEGHLLSVLYRE
jgi:hypothetical protein